MKNLPDKILQFSKLFFSLSEFKFLPSWTVLITDLFLCVIALKFSKVLVFNVNNVNLFNEQNYFIEALIILSSLSGFVIVGTYRGPIRHSNFSDVVKFLASGVISSLIIITIPYLASSLIEFNINTDLSVVVFYEFFSFTLLFLLRVFVKQLFHYTYNSIYDNPKRVIVFGVNPTSVSLVSSLMNDATSQFNVLGFISDKKINRKKILGLPIIQRKNKVSAILRYYGAEGIIISDQTINRKSRVNLIEDCLAFNYKAFTAPNKVDKEQLGSNQIKNVEIEDLLGRTPIMLENNLIEKELFKKIVLITGAAGSIGSELVRQISYYDVKKIILIDNAETPLHNLKCELDKKNLDFEVKCILGDVSNHRKIEKVFKTFKPDIVYHAAAYKHVPLMESNPSESVFINVLGSKNVADLSLKYDAKKFVMVSTDKAVNPSNVMGASKRIAELYVQSLHDYTKSNNAVKTEFIITRFGNVLGSNGSVVPLFKKQIEEGGPITITHKEIIRYFMTIPEACQLVLEAASMGKSGQIFLFDMGNAVKIYDLAERLIKLSGLEPHKDIEIKTIGLRPGEKLYEELLADKSKTLPTYNKKILISKEPNADFNQISDEISVLINYAENFDNHKLVSQMKIIVPEFKSFNSEYESLDKIKL